MKMNDVRSLSPDQAVEPPVEPPVKRPLSPVQGLEGTTVKIERTGLAAVAAERANSEVDSFFVKTMTERYEQPLDATWSGRIQVDMKYSNSLRLAAMHAAPVLALRSPLVLIGSQIPLLKSDPGSQLNDGH